MRTLGLCLIGCGRAGMIHARNYKNKVPGAKMVAVADVVEEARRLPPRRSSGSTRGTPTTARRSKIPRSTR